MGDLERITARRSELDGFTDELTKQLQEVQAEREELLVAERVLNRLAEQDRAEGETAVAASPAPARVAGQAVLLIPHRGEEPDEAALPGDYREILAIVRVADDPVQVRAVGEELGLEVAVRGKLEPLRAKMTKLADRGWLHKRPDGRSPHAGSHTGTVRRGVTCGPPTAVDVFCEEQHQPRRGP
ncbi:hypothetical protein OOK58_01475 [Streptomyces sp. NBC_01728]|uniref:hypothetical protein n=1 Tax=unclassified Streptomyces TaxID=2593676 RepID=UPI0022517A56|nr:MULTISPECIES: hypothetical protein [unclassified Streptomyces]MCX4461373.1 hypothetical protein [Streptomyces sp. NBC_01719]MCX4490281.1 hypothetical protein [Streptomyces sp. NBC_01728]MCX4597080.1 hypothetical protein [Streptomyces sp. NBC_01549]